MPLLLDGNISRHLKNHLAAYHDGKILSIFDVGFDEAEDIDIWQYAKEHGFDILTKDADFLDIAIRLGPPPKVIFLHVGNGPTRTIIELFSRHRQEIQERLNHEEVSIIILEK
jgi:predicted nuclease of predicted toxin-antitoxin system